MLHVVNYPFFVSRSNCVYWLGIRVIGWNLQVYGQQWLMQV